MLLFTNMEVFILVEKEEQKEIQIGTGHTKQKKCNSYFKGHLRC